MPQSVLTDQQLLKLISAKSRAGAEALYDKYAKVLRLAIFHIVQEKELTDTLLEKTIHKIWDTADQYNEQELPLLTWMLGITKTLSKEYSLKEAQPVSA